MSSAYTVLGPIALALDLWRSYGLQSLTWQPGMHGDDDTDYAHQPDGGAVVLEVPLEVFDLDAVDGYDGLSVKAGGEEDG